MRTVLFRLSRSAAPIALVLFLAAGLTLAQGCSSGSDKGGSGGTDARSTDGSKGRSSDATTTTTEKVAPVEVTEASFKALSDMTPVRGFFVDNLLGDLDATLKVARSSDGGTYPIGSVVQLVPGEAMVKREPGFAPVVNDWEFFELDVNAQGTTIRKRGGAEVVNRFGGSCSSCHLAADPKWDLICEDTHGCDTIPLDDKAIKAIQVADPRPHVAAG